MNKFLAGLAIGVPVGMIVADREGVAARFRRDLRGITYSGGADVAAAVNRIAESTRERASEQRESATINGVSREELLAVYGIGPALTQRILDGRPYRSDHEVVENGTINEKTYRQLCRQVLVKHKEGA